MKKKKDRGKTNKEGKGSGIEGGESKQECNKIKGKHTAKGAISEELEAILALGRRKANRKHSPAVWHVKHNMHY